MQSEKLVEEFSRLVREYKQDDGPGGIETWNLIADFAIDNAEAIEAALSAAEPFRWMWEERRFAESDIWDDMYDDEPPAPHKHVRNIRPLYAAPAGLPLAVDAVYANAEKAYGIEYHKNGIFEDALKAALSSALSSHAPSEPYVVVNALEWSEEHRDDYAYVEAETPFGKYRIDWKFWKDADTRFPDITAVDGSVVSYDGEGLDAAKAAAQADFEDRIRSALSAQVQDVATPQRKHAFSLSDHEIRMMSEGTMIIGGAQMEMAQEIIFLRSLLHAAPAKQEGDRNEAN